MADRPSRSAWPSSDDVNGWNFVVGFAILIFGTYLVGAVLGAILHGDTVLPSVVPEPILFPVLFVFAPAVLAGVNKYRGASVASSVAVGFVPGLLFPIIAFSADIFGVQGIWNLPVWTLSLYYGGAGLLSALFGTVVAVVVEWTLEKAK